MNSFTQSRGALEAYEALALDYDDFTAGYAHGKWFEEIHARVQDLGVPGRRALDLACGTGLSTRPLLDAGYSVRACDISPEMIERARPKFAGETAEFFVADIRALPDLGPADLILCLDDSVNYLLSTQELTAAFSGAARTLGPGGILVFDANTLATYRSAFAQTFVRESAERFFAWQGRGSLEMAQGELAVAELEVFGLAEDGYWVRRSSRHEQRHHPRETLIDALEGAGLHCCAVFGQLPGAQLEDDADELRHIKTVYVARRER